jgi:hypothetical protein
MIGLITGRILCLRNEPRPMNKSQFEHLFFYVTSTTTRSVPLFTRSVDEAGYSQLNIGVQKCSVSAPAREAQRMRDREIYDGSPGKKVDVVMPVKHLTN